MAGGLIALLDDVAALAKIAGASVDDVAAAAGRAGTKAAGVVIDDAAVTPGYVVGLPPERELPIIWKITLGSLRNKLIIILPIALLLSAFASWAITPLLMVGGAYLAFEAVEKIWHALKGDDHASEVLTITDPVELEQRQVSGAVRTDFILSAEIMAIALNEMPNLSLPMQAGALAAVGIAITIAVYGAVALIVKMDDVGLHLHQRPNAAVSAIGTGLVKLMPVLLTALSRIGTAAMLWVGGGIFLHGLEVFHLTPLPALVHDAAHAAGTVGGGALEWLVQALGSAVIGVIVGAIVTTVMHFVPKKKAH